MSYSEVELARDIERIQRIPIIPTLLNVICETTGMGFAAVARVTEDRWITCSVRDDIQFGLQPGSELTIQTTICNEIRDSHQPVVIEHVQQNERFCNHHTPAMYGFQSYISFPIILKSGEFFGTLCAIDPRPAQLESTKIRGLFAAFTELISLHLQQSDLLEESDYARKNLSRQLTNSQDENRQYRHISSHTLQEPLRKLRLFSGMLVEAIRINEREKAGQLAVKINQGAERFSALLKDLTSFSDLEKNQTTFQPTDLDYTLGLVITELRTQLDIKEADVRLGPMPTVPGIPAQLELLFYHLVENAIKFSKPDQVLALSIDSNELISTELIPNLSPDKQYVEIKLRDDGIGINPSQLEKIFDLFSQLPTGEIQRGAGIGLSICRKVLRNHSGQISIHSEVDVGTTVSVILPLS
ncbi:HAMP domain-containing sensor histidine kinase [Spirosoma flavus]